MRQSRRTLFLLCGMLIAFPNGTRLSGQAVTATLVGQVSDSSGAAIGAAEVSITEQGAGTTTVHTTNESGNYEFTFLPPGTYTVSVKREGFDVSVTKGVHVAVNTTVRLDAKLTIGSLAQTVSVNDHAPILQTDRADVSGQIESKQISDLPVGSSRNFQSLETLIPGVSPAIYDHSAFFDAQNSQSSRSTVSRRPQTTCNSKASTTMSAPGNCRFTFRPRLPSKQWTSRRATIPQSSAVPPAP